MNEEELKRFRQEMARRAAIGLPLTPEAKKEQDKRSLPFLAEPVNPDAEIVEIRLTELTQNFNDEKRTWRQRMWRWIISTFRWIFPKKD